MLKNLAVRLNLKRYDTRWDFKQSIRIYKNSKFIPLLKHFRLIYIVRNVRTVEQNINNQDKIFNTF